MPVAKIKMFGEEKHVPLGTSYAQIALARVQRVHYVERL